MIRVGKKMNTSKTKPGSVTSHPLLDGLKQIADGLAQALGPEHEVIVHDLRHDLDTSIVATGGNVTGRKIGGPMTDLGLRLLKASQQGAKTLTYQTRTKDGRVLKSSTMFVRDNDQKVVGCLCINCDLTHWVMAKNMLQRFCETTDFGMSTDGDSPEFFGQDVNEILKVNVDKAVDLTGKPVALMQKEDKLRIVKYLDERGIFLIKKGVPYVARVLNVSRCTVYNYMDEARSFEAAT